MLFLVFQLGSDRYALESSQIVEVLPLVRWKKIPQAAAGVAGAFNYRGAPVPLIDLAQFSLGQPSRRYMSTRIVVVKYADDRGETRLLGLLAEHATEMITRSAEQFVDPGVSADGAPYLGPVTNDSRGIIQRIDIDRLLPAEVRDQLFREATEAA